VAGTKESFVDHEAGAPVAVERFAIETRCKFPIKMKADGAKNQSVSMI
jgi:hypothetical protein